MKHVIYQPKLDDWRLNTVDEISKIIESITLKAASEALGYALKESDTYAYFPMQYGGKHDGLMSDMALSDQDPLTIYLRIGLKTGESDDAPTYRFTLAECLESAIEACEEDGSYSEGLEQIQKGLIELAGKLGTVIATAKANTSHLKIVK